MLSSLEPPRKKSNIPDTRDLHSAPESEDNAPDTLESFADIDYGPEDEECSSGDAKTRWGEDSKCNPHIVAHAGAPPSENTLHWHPLFHLAPSLYMMSRRIGSGIATALLYIHSFRPLLAHTFLETERMVQTDPRTLTTTADKLRYYRHVRGLEQKEVADYIGLYPNTYAGYEKPSARDYYPLDKLRALAELFEVSLEDLLDDYNTFLYEGQGRQVRALRESMGLSRGELAERFGVWPATIRDWEINSVRMTKQTWKRLFRS